MVQRVEQGGRDEVRLVDDGVRDGSAVRPHEAQRADRSADDDDAIG